MIRLERVAVATVLTAFLSFPVYLLSRANGAPAGRTGGPFPGEQSCATAGCHGTGSLGGPGSIAIAIDGAEPGPDFRYESGRTYQLDVTISDPSAMRWGFQLTARAEDDGCEQAGTLESAEQDVSVDPGRSPGDCTGIDLANHTFPKAGPGSATFMVNWTPGDGDDGNVIIAAAGNAANGNGNPSGDAIYTTMLTVQPAEVVNPGPMPTISDGGVVHGASLSADQGFAPNTFVTLFGSDFGGGLADWSESFVDGVAPTELADIQVLVNGNPAFISFVGDGASTDRNFDQINILTADDEARGPVNVEVVTPGGRSEPFVVMLEEAAPAFFVFEPDGRRHVAAVDNVTGRLIGPSDLFGEGAADIGPASPGDVLALFFTGGGPTDPPVPAGTLPTVVSETASELKVLFGAVEAEVLFSGLSQFAGLYQAVITVPAVDPGEVEVVGEIGGKITQPGAIIVVGEAVAAASE